MAVPASPLVPGVDLRQALLAVTLAAVTGTAIAAASQAARFQLGSAELLSGLCAIAIAFLAYVAGAGPPGPHIIYCPLF